jgi:hypothetical protein
MLIFPKIPVIQSNLNEPTTIEFSVADVATSPEIALIASSSPDVLEAFSCRNPKILSHFSR